MVLFTNTKLVAKGLLQVHVLDYKESFALIAKVVIVRNLLTLVAKRSWILNQLDINNAFLHGYSDADLYFTLPQGTQSLVGHVYSLNEAFY